jgi:5'-3' exonuclease
MHKNYLEDYNQFFSSPKIKTDKVLLVDGLNLFIRAFSVIPTLNDNGEHTGGVVGFYNTVRKLIKDYNATKAIIVFDGKGGNARRRKLYKEYKSKRISIGVYNRFEDVKGLIDENSSMTRQLGIIIESLAYLPVYTIILDGVEADDVIAYITKHYFQDNHSKVIATSDKDYLQLIDSTTSIYSLNKKMLLTEENFYENVGYLPRNFLTLRCFTGDISDNINGVTKVGQKLMDKFFNLNHQTDIISIDSILEISTQKVTEKVKTKAYHSIVNEEHIVRRNYELMQLQDPPISGILTSHIRGMLDSNPPKFDKFKYYDYLIGNGISTSVDDYKIWEKVGLTVL